VAGDRRYHGSDNHNGEGHVAGHGGLEVQWRLL